MEIRSLAEPSPEPFDPKEWSPAELDPDPGASTRRQWIQAIGAAALGAGAATAVTQGLGMGTQASSSWIDFMQSLPAADLIRFAGIFEAKARQEPAPRAVPAFERLLEVAIDRDEPGADVAGAAAVRTLAALGDVAPLRRLTARAQRRPLTVRAMEAALRSAIPANN